MTPRSSRLLIATVLTSGVATVALSSCGSKTGPSPYDSKEIDRYCFQLTLTFSSASEGYHRYAAEPPCASSSDVGRCELMYRREPERAIERERARMRDLILGWTERDDVARWFQNDLQFCGDVVPGDGVDHRRKVAALGERFVAATPTEAAATVAELAGLSVDLSRRVRATLRSNPRSFRDQAVAKHCQQVWTTVAAAVEAYERYAKDARCRDSSDNCMTKLDESARADESARRLALPLGWEDRWDVDSFLNEDLRFCLFVISDGQRGAVEEAYTARLRSGQFTKHAAGPVEEVAAGVREYRDLAHRMKLRFETLAKGSE